MEAAAGLVSWTDAVANVARVCGGERAALTCRPLGLDPRIPSAAWQLDTSAFENDYLKSRRIWKAHGLQPHRWRRFKLSNDPKFAKKLRDVVGLYVDPPAHAVVLSLDEKSQIQARDRT